MCILVGCVGYSSKDNWCKKMEMMENKHDQVNSNALKCETTVNENVTGDNFVLRFPKSRINMKEIVTNDIEKTEGMEDWKWKIQLEFNSSPIGPYMGPYDQSDCMPLSVQLTDSALEFETYTQYQHDEVVKCRQFDVIPNKEYKKLGDLEKIDALVESVKATEDDDENDDESQSDQIYHTCVNGGCKIPCPCKDCCTNETQCKFHRIAHPDRFNPKLHRRTIRSCALLCKDDSFFDRGKSYTNNYSGIPKSCQSCGTDLFHHNAYHLKFHRNCKYCILNKFKYRVKNASQLKEETKFEESYFSHVCPICDKTFSQRNIRDQHVVYAHKNSPYKCDSCEKSFSSLKAKNYHENVVHRNLERVKCEACGKTFTSSTNLGNRVKYVHSEVCN